LSVFAWTAPLFKLASRRWSEDDFRTIADLLRPYVAPGGVFADLGGGTGDLGAGVAPALGARVVVVDPTPQMLRRVEAHPWVSTRLASAERLPFPSAYFDALLCCDAFHHFRDQKAALKEIHRVVRAGGGVLMLEVQLGEGWGRLPVLLERLLGEPAGFQTPAGLETLLAAHGIAGASRRQTGTSYLFVGTVRP
jgi:SAM-dependent methyltransferase